MGQVTTKDVYIPLRVHMHHFISWATVAPKTMRWHSWPYLGLYTTRIVHRWIKDPFKPLASQLVSLVTTLRAATMTVAKALTIDPQQFQQLNHVKYLKSNWEINNWTRSAYLLNLSQTFWLQDFSCFQTALVENVIQIKSVNLVKRMNIHA